MAGLVIKEEVGFEFAQKLSLGQAAEKHGFVHVDVPIHQGAYGPLMGRCAACRNECSAYAHAGAARRARHLQPVQRGKQWFEGAIGQGLRSLGEDSQGKLSDDGSILAVRSGSGIVLSKGNIGRWIRR